jgi:hypothetical protein
MTAIPGQCEWETASNHDFCIGRKVCKELTLEPIGEAGHFLERVQQNQRSGTVEAVNHGLDIFGGGSDQAIQKC